MESLLDLVLRVALILHIVMLAAGMWRIWRGQTVADRLIGVDLVTILLMAILVLASLILDDTIYIDIALVLAALGFITAIALSAYLADDQMF